MELKRCSKGHFYDAEANSTCPQCAAELAATSGAPTVPGGGMQDYDKTEPMSQGGTWSPGGGANATQPVNATSWGPSDFSPAGGSNDPGATEPVNATSWGPSDFAGGQGSVQEYDAVTEPAGFSDAAAGFYPVVGWLVSVEGPSKGTDYRIRAGYNYIGRDDYMDICVKGDNQISRNKHAMIAYDPEENLFFFGPADGKSLVRLNGKVVMAAQELHSYDTLKIGSTQFRFIALCNEEFSW